MICLKIRTFVVSATTLIRNAQGQSKLWFAWKFVPLWYQQQLWQRRVIHDIGCDLLENSYLCGISNNSNEGHNRTTDVVICLKIRTFVVSATTINISIWVDSMLWFAWKFVPLWYQQQLSDLVLAVLACCDLLENSYLCGISNNAANLINTLTDVVICLKIRTFVVSATTYGFMLIICIMLWFAWKFVPLWYQQQQ